MIKSGDNTKSGKAQMSPDQMDALRPFIETADPAIKAIYEELRLTRQQMCEDKKELTKEMRDGFSSIAGQCRARIESCSAARINRDERVAALALGQAVNKTKLSFLIGGSALGGGIGAKIIEWLTSK